MACSITTTMMITLSTRGAVLEEYAKSPIMPFLAAILGEEDYMTSDAFEAFDTGKTWMELTGALEVGVQYASRTYHQRKNPETRVYSHGP